MSGLTFAELRKVSDERVVRWHGARWRYADRDYTAAHMGMIEVDHWTAADWSNAMNGEAGEAANVVKKLRRIEGGLPGNRKPGDDDRDLLLEKLGAELADTLIYADLLASYYGIDLGAAIVSKFNRVSEELGLPDRLGAS